MTVEFGDYVPLPEGAVPGPSMSRKTAREAFTELMKARASRRETLVKLLRRNGVAADLRADMDMDLLDQWFTENVQGEVDCEIEPNRMWRGVATDVGLLLGGLIVERYPQLSWRLYTWLPSSDIHQSPVIMGFSTEDPKFHTCFEPIAHVLGHAHRTLYVRHPEVDLGSVQYRGVEIDLNKAAGSLEPEESGNGLVQALAAIDRRA